MRILFFYIAALHFFSSVSQNKLTKDIDFDGIPDTIFIDYETAQIVCTLSSKNFKKVKSKTITDLSESSRISKAKNGFYFGNNWMRAGYAAQFRYDKKQKRIRLIGIIRYNLGNATHEGSGESSINLLTGDYISDWHYYDEKLIKIPTITTKMHFKKIYLTDFSEKSYSNFSDKCSKLFYKHKKQLKQ